MVNESAPKRLFVTTGEVESLQSDSHAMYFIRTNPKGVQEKGFEQDIMAGEIRGSALDSFRALVANLFVPVLKNQTQWGKAQEENTHEFVQSVAKFGATLTEASNSLQGGVELMKPPRKYVESIELKPAAFAAAAEDPKTAADMQMVLQDWCERTDELLSGVEDGRKESDDAGPDTELEYWRSRMAKFNSITEQLKSNECRLVLGVSMAARSQAHKEWKAIDMKVTDAANESKDNVKYLTTLEKSLEPMYVGEPRQILDGLPALLNNIKMMHTVAVLQHSSARRRSSRRCRIRSSTTARSISPRRNAVEPAQGAAARAPAA